MAAEGGAQIRGRQSLNHVGLVRNRRDFGFYLRVMGTYWMVQSRIRPDLTWTFKGPRDSVKHGLKGLGMEAVRRSTSRWRGWPLTLGWHCGWGVTCSARRPTWKVGLTGFANEELGS